VRLDLPASEAVSLAVATAADGSVSGWRISSAAGDLVVDLSLEGRSQFSTLGGFELVWLTSAERASLASRPIDGVNGLGSAVAPLLGHLSQEVSPSNSGATRLRLAVILRGLLSGVAAERAEADSSDRSISSQQRLVVQAMQIIHERLTDSDLAVGRIAAGVGVSVRTLQGAFQDSGLSAAGLIRALRLERARIDIEGNAAGGPVSAASIGLRWGFRDGATFARAFVGRYGQRPDQARATIGGAE
jgi:AraC-like DNA-binding protein